MTADAAVRLVRSAAPVGADRAHADVRRLGAGIADANRDSPRARRNGGGRGVAGVAAWTAAAYRDSPRARRAGGERWVVAGIADANRASPRARRSGRWIAAGIADPDRDSPRTRRSGGGREVAGVTAGTADANRDRDSPRASRGGGGRGVAAAGVAQLGVCGHHLGESCRVGGLRTGVRVEGEQQGPVGRADLGRGGIARHAEHAVRVRWRRVLVRRHGRITSPAARGRVRCRGGTRR
jgi:hypothetical protein